MGPLVLALAACSAPASEPAPVPGAGPAAGAGTASVPAVTATPSAASPSASSASSASSSAAPPAAGASPVLVDVVQRRSDVETGDVAVEVTPEADVRVLGVELVAPGTDGAGLVPQDALITAGRTVALAVPAGVPRCDAAGREAATGPASVRLVLDGVPDPLVLDVADERGLLARLHGSGCAALAAGAALPAAWDPVWTTRGTGADLVAVGVLHLGPAGGAAAAGAGSGPADGTVTVTGVGSTTLFEVTVPQLPLALAAGERRDVEVELSPARCDLHAVAEDKQGFGFEVALDVGGEALTTRVWVPRTERGPATAALLERCAAAG